MFKGKNLIEHKFYLITLLFILLSGLTNNWVLEFTAYDAKPYVIVQSATVIYALFGVTYLFEEPSNYKCLRALELIVVCLVTLPYLFLVMVGVDFVVFHNRGWSYTDIFIIYGLFCGIITVLFCGWLAYVRLLVRYRN